MNLRRNASTLAALLAVVLVAGCSLSQSPVGPGASGTGNAGPPPVATFGPGETVGYVWAPVADGVGGPLKSGEITSRALNVSVPLDGSRGGTVQAGRFSVRLPAGAFVGPATVTVSMPDSSVMVCDLSITPQTANKFKVPAELTVNLSSPEVTNATGFTMYWYDPGKNTWVNLFAKSRVSGATVTTILDHFSKYAAGKAGW